MYIMPVLIITSVIYYVLIVPKIRNKAFVENSKIKNALIGKEKETRPKYLYDENRFQPISELIVNEEVLGITDCMKRKSGKQVAITMVVNFLKDFAESLIRKFMHRGLGVMGGYQFSRGDKGLFYLVISNKALHYLFFDEGKLIEHQRFSFHEIENFNQNSANMADQFLKGGAMKYPKISFKTTKEQFTFFYTESIECYPSGEPLETNAMYEVNHLFVTPFKNEINQI